MDGDIRTMIVRIIRWKKYIWKDQRGKLLEGIERICKKKYEIYTREKREVESKKKEEERQN